VSLTPRKDNEEDDEDGMTKSVDYICGLIDKEVDGGVPVEKILVGGFSQGCAISLLIGSMSRYKGKLARAVGLSGHMPLNEKVGKAIKERKEGDTATTKWLIAHGWRDQLVPRRIFTGYRAKLRDWEDECVEAYLYEGMAHSTTGPEIRDLCAWLEGVLPVS